VTDNDDAIECGGLFAENGGDECVLCNGTRARHDDPPEE
jgi:hypothetical protein